MKAPPAGSVEACAVAYVGRGHRVTKLVGKPRPGARKGVLNKHVKFVRDIVRETTGFAPYEKRTLELLRIGKDKKACKFLKNRIGGIRRAKRKRDEMQGILTAQRKAGGAHK